MKLDIREKKVLITAFKQGNIKYAPNAAIMNASRIAGIHHLIAAAEYALSRERRIAKNLAIEIMIMASAQREISRAIDIFDPSSADIKALVIVADSWAEIENYLSENRILPDDSLIGCGEEVKDVFKITEKELRSSVSRDSSRAILNAVLTRMAAFISREE